ncbi:hypothetical protein [Peterkaempfera griseoplana]|uniref:hypothetical protein n=1 Tax=Peterkaempfera griseoplana TaxID=66896 RepID=UPI0006E460D6|nr:hypothetical protein [Peterkaempfera griseoplana]
MPHVRKAVAGSDSFGHEWPHDGAVVEMPHEEAEALLAIADGGFELVADPAPGPEDQDPDDTTGSGDDDQDPAEEEPDAGEEEPDADPAVTEPAPEQPQTLDEVAPEPAAEDEKPAPRRNARRKTGE